MIQDMDRCKQDGEYFEAQLGTDRGFLITYELFTEESVEEGDSADGGYQGYESCEPDKYDQTFNDNEKVTAVSKAVRFFTRDHCVEPSSSHFHEGVWYTDADGEQDYRSGDETRLSYHPKNFTVAEQQEIFKAVR